MKFACILLGLFLSVSPLLAQKGSITGTIKDTFNNVLLENAVISVLRAKDSVLIRFTRSGNKGNFSLQNLPQQRNILMITYPGYADYFDEVDLSAKAESMLGEIALSTKARLLADVTVRQKIAAIRMRGDTIEYNADSFKVREGASVEEMIRKMPGLQVDKDGNITAQGTKVEKVLVDGEEFFGDDPTMATKNLQADAIDKVQVFDKKSDQAAFTGIDDGSKTKTINLTMKADKKKGYFGKLDLGAGPNDRWNNTLMLNAFKDKRKFSVYGIMSSTGKTGLSWDESSRYGSDNGMQYDADGGYFFTSGGGDDLSGFDGTYGGEGIPKSWSTGVNYGNKFHLDKQSLNGSYRYTKLNTEGAGNTITQSILPNNTFTNLEDRSSFNSRERHSINGTYDWQLDSFTSIKVTANGFQGTNFGTSGYRSQSLDSLGQMINSSNRNAYSNGTNNSLSSNFLLRRRFKRIGRTVSLSFDQQSRNTESNGYLYSFNQFFSKAGLINTDTIDQQKINEVSNSGYFTKAVFTEPLAKAIFLEINAGYRVSNSESRKLSYDKGFGGKYDVLNDTFSNHYDFKVLTSSAGTMLRFNGKKLTLAGGGEVAFADFRQEDVIRKSVINYNYTNFFPRSQFNYKFNTNTRLSINYNGNTRQPAIEQLQPIRDNTNPLNIAIGNPDLKQEFRHSFNMNFNSYKVLSQRGLYVYGSFSTVSNAITTNEQTATSGDSIGRRTYQYINMNGNYNGFSGGGYSMKLKKADMNINFGFSINVNSNNNIVNRLRNTTRNNSFGLNLGASKFKEKKYDVNYNGRVQYNTSVSSIQPGRKTNYYTHGHDVYLNISLPYKLEFNTSVNANFRQRINAFDRNNDQVVWNGYIGRKLMKNDKGLISLAVNDILDQNRGFNRVINSTLIREDNYETLRRYLLLKFTWNFSKTPGGMQPR
ncbi:hypothetical protein EXU57_10525 [Segetibacter sp. 3557_3]|uniref:TonB-dependent receptor n=1 Tax=Segetibacter sp. 3557_3 TaxID=2547429 RepID=UPI001058FF07|nr:TonB-dependent receptor [Segetibacter sp. 3557_3]TDH26517.1 hypothetical protein EXU57_10525 [Segetibacter sp. 3557_3]